MIVRYSFGRLSFGGAEQRNRLNYFNCEVFDFLKFYLSLIITNLNTILKRFYLRSGRAIASTLYVTWHPISQEKWSIQSVYIKFLEILLYFFLNLSMAPNGNKFDPSFSGIIKIFLKFKFF